MDDEKKEPRPINNRKFKVLQIPYGLVLATIEECKGGYGLPKDAIVQDVRESWEYGCFEFKINSDSYDETKQGVVADKIQIMDENNE